MPKTTSFDVLKKKRPVVVGENDEFRLINIEEKSFDPDKREKFEYIHKTIEQLPDKYKTVIKLRDIDGFTFEEIKEFTGFEITHIRVILSRARLKVKKEIEKIYNYDETKRFVR